MGIFRKLFGGRKEERQAPQAPALTNVSIYDRLGVLAGRDGVVCCVDYAGFVNGQLGVRGWALHESVELDGLRVVAEAPSGACHELELVCGLPRDDLARAMPASPGALRAGFSAQAADLQEDELSIRALVEVGGAELSVDLGSIVQARGHCPVEQRSGVAVLCASREDASRRYRAEHLVEELERRGVRAQLIDISRLEDGSFASFRHAVIQRAFGQVPAEPLVRYYQEGGTVLYEVDDAIFVYDLIMQNDLHKHDPLFQEANVRQMRRVMASCDALIASTLPLQELMEREFPGKRVFLNGNVASQEMLRQAERVRSQPRERDGLVRLGYFSGSSTHNQDFSIVAGPLEQLFESCPEARLVVVGNLALPEDFERRHEGRIERFERVPWQELPQLIARVDINLLPLEDTAFNECKSAIKWMEAALVGVVTVASSSRELARVIESGKTGLLCTSEQEWVEALTNLAADAGLREALAAQALDEVLAHHSTDSIDEGLLDYLTAEKEVRPCD